MSFFAGTKKDNADFARQGLLVSPGGAKSAATGAPSAVAGIFAEGHR